MANKKIGDEMVDALYDADWLARAKENFMQCKSEYLSKDLSLKQWIANKRRFERGEIGIIQTSFLEIGGELQELNAVMWVEKDIFKTKKCFTDNIHPYELLSAHTKKYPGNKDLLRDDTYYYFYFSPFSCLPLDLLKKWQETDIRDLNRTDWALIRSIYNVKQDQRRKKTKKDEYINSGKTTLPTQFIRTQTQAGYDDFYASIFKNQEHREEQIKKVLLELKKGDALFVNRNGTKIERRTYFPLTSEEDTMYNHLLNYVFEHKKNDFRKWYNSRSSADKFFFFDIDLPKFIMAISKDKRAREKTIKFYVKMLQNLRYRQGYIFDAISEKEIIFTRTDVINITEDLFVNIEDGISETENVTIGLPYKIIEGYALDDKKKLLGTYSTSSNAWLNAIPNNEVAHKCRYFILEKRELQRKNYKKNHEESSLINKVTYKQFAETLDGYKRAEDRRSLHKMKEIIKITLDISREYKVIKDFGLEKGYFWFKYTKENETKS